MRKELLKDFVSTFHDNAMNICSHELFIQQEKPDSMHEFMLTVGEDFWCGCFLKNIPCCFIQKVDIGDLGTHSDWKIRSSRVRKDNEPRRDRIQRACRLIYENGVDVGSDHVEKILGPYSLVPTQVSVQ